MNVNDKDRKNELIILNVVKNKVEEFKDYIFEQTTEKAELFDFVGKKEIKIEVKIRDISSTDFETYFISKEKGDEVAKNINQHFIIYAFKGDKVIRIYDLRKVDLKDKELDFVHKRTGQKMKQKVYEVKSDQFIKEIK